MGPIARMQDKEQIAYQIEIQGRLDKEWSDWFNGIQIDYGKGTTLLTAGVIDQPRLRGILCKLWDLNLTIISVNQVTSHNNVHDSKPRRQ